MSLWNVLYETYDNLMKTECKPPLMPIATTTQNAQIEITINENAEMIDASVVMKDDCVTVIPCTEASGCRSGQHPKNHPLMDKLQYLAGDYTLYGGKKGDSFYAEYMSDLKEWCDSPYANKKVQVLNQYLLKKRLIQDLVENKVIYLDENGCFIEKWMTKDEKPPIYSVCIGDISDAFVRIRVKGFGNQTALWGIENNDVQTDFINFYLASRTVDGFCYITGKETSCASSHPYKIRNTGDKAKLISANDSSGFTYRGRFADGREAVNVGYEVSQKIHNALRWLVENQGKRYGERVYVTWNPRVGMAIDIDGDSDVFGNVDVVGSAKEFAEQLHKNMSGYFSKLEYNDKIVIVGLDAATTGRMAVVFYREMLENELIMHLETWYRTCSWEFFYDFENKCSRMRTPAPKEIAEAAFGVQRSNYLEVDKKVYSQVIDRILHCIIDGTPLQRDIIQSAFRNVCHPQNYTDSNWRKILRITCAVLKKYYYDNLKKEKGEWTVEVMKDEKDINYLCGRLLAVADVLENKAQDDHKHTTAAIRYFTRFTEHPCQTWDIINKALMPYYVKLGDKAYYYKKDIAEIAANIDSVEFANARNLDGRMALGFYSQLHEYYKNKTVDHNDDIEEEEK